MFRLASRTAVLALVVAIPMTSGYAEDGWTLASKFMQAPGVGTNKLTDDEYAQVFASADWIKGAGVDGAPTSPDPDFMSGGFRFESIDWRSVLTATGKTYKLRQQFYRGAEKSSQFDVSYSFKYQGHVTQDDAIGAGQPSAQAFLLADRTVCCDTTGISWDTNRAAQMRFWLPFTTASAGHAVYSGCGGYSFDQLGCGSNISTARRRGCAGIIPDQVSAMNSDHSASWGPLLDKDNRNGGAHDIVFVRNGFNGSGSVYGNRGGEDGVVLQYWLCASGDCACPHACGGSITHEMLSGLGYGGLSMVLFFIAVLVYVVGGAYRNNKAGTAETYLDLLPHRAFWGQVCDDIVCGMRLTFRRTKRVVSTRVLGYAHYDEL